MDNPGITDREFALFQRLIYRLAGISMSDAKKVLMVGRLGKRLRHYDLASFGDYYRLLASGTHPDELQTMVDLLTTNETYFFREPAHFEFLREFAASRKGGAPFRIWSGACSSGEEPYTMALVLAETLGLSTSWEIVASDISMTVLERARAGLYPLERAEGIPQPLLKKYCLKGVREQQGNFLICPELRERIDFRQLNLVALDAPNLGHFDVIFLRNVMIYFDTETKARVIANMLPHLKQDGRFIVGHSETLHGVTDELAALRPTLYKRASVQSS
ncbi:CheR family methyltransferase [Azoarcus olearius]|uniref:Chemotaxis protein methyltransferase n=1 Tax=Azoarcus sp. (strain BH72) TaxID=418699 RepID=A1K2G5_AZOSB|nr:protein-glutamate O-methyltransferase CheR [Azoarcus olearius]CAL93020.1 probable chemotaxis protein methyltransferase [Azoarcus olearius]